MTDIDKRNLIAQWSFDARPVLLRFHLWLEDVEVDCLAPGATLGTWKPPSALLFMSRLQGIVLA